MPPPFFALYCSLAFKVCQIQQRSQDRHHDATIDEKIEVLTYPTTKIPTLCQLTTHITTININCGFLRSNQVKLSDGLMKNPTEPNPLTPLVERKRNHNIFKNEETSVVSTKVVFFLDFCFRSIILIPL